jgi:peptidoglycan/LPS O-acetylase OafA/YrhL
MASNWIRRLIPFRGRSVGDRASTDTEGRIPALDGVRGIAILLVMGHHYGQQLIPLHPIDVPVLGALSIGWVGVDLFFVLSGFLITGILYDTRRARNYFQSFYARRILRIFPLSYAALTFFFVLVPLLGSKALGETASRWPWFWLYASNFLIARHGWVSRYVQHFWSLAIEEQFYLVWPLLVFILPRRRLIGLSLGAIIGAAALRGVFYDGGGWMHATTNFTHTLTRVDALAMGAAIALLLRDPRGARWLKRLAPWVLVFAVPVALQLLARSSEQPAWILWGPRGQIVGYSLVALTFAAMIAWSVTGSKGLFLNRFFGNRSLRFFGRYSYAMYIIHLPLDTAARAWGLRVKPIAQRLGAVTPVLIIYSVLAGGLTVGLALVSWNLLEKRFLALKRHFVASGGTPGPVIGMSGEAVEGLDAK